MEKVLTIVYYIAILAIGLAVFHRGAEEFNRASELVPLLRGSLWMLVGGGVFMYNVNELSKEGE